MLGIESGIYAGGIALGLAQGGATLSALPCDAELTRCAGFVAATAMRLITVGINAAPEAVQGRVF